MTTPARSSRHCSRAQSDWEQNEDRQIPRLKSGYIAVQVLHRLGDEVMKSLGG